MQKYNEPYDSDMIEILKQNGVFYSVEVALNSTKEVRDEIRKGFDLDAALKNYEGYISAEILAESSPDVLDAQLKRRSLISVEDMEKIKELNPDFRFSEFAVIEYTIKYINDGWDHNPEIYTEESLISMIAYLVGGTGAFEGPEYQNYSKIARKEKLPRTPYDERLIVVYKLYDQVTSNPEPYLDWYLSETTEQASSDQKIQQISVRANGSICKGYQVCINSEGTWQCKIFYNPENKGYTGYTGVDVIGALLDKTYHFLLRVPSYSRDEYHSLRPQQKAKLLELIQTPEVKSVDYHLLENVLPHLKF